MPRPVHSMESIYIFTRWRRTIRRRNHLGSWRWSSWYRYGVRCQEELRRRQRWGPKWNFLQWYLPLLWGFKETLRQSGVWQRVFLSTYLLWFRLLLWGLGHPLPKCRAWKILWFQQRCFYGGQKQLRPIHGVYLRQREPRHRFFAFLLLINFHFQRRRSSNFNDLLLLLLLLGESKLQRQKSRFCPNWHPAFSIRQWDWVQRPQIEE